MVPAALVRSSLVLSLSLCAACAAPRPPGEPARPSAESRRPAERPRPVAASRPAALSAEPDPVRDEALRALWDDPAFQRRLAESYLAETEIEPRIAEEEREPLQAVLALIAKDRMNEAVRELEALRGEGASAVFDFTLANVHFQREELDAARAAYEAAVAKHPKFRRAWKNLGLIRMRQDDLAGAREALTRVLELGGVDALTYGLLGFVHSGLGDPVAAESAYRAANLLDAGTLDWRMGLARSFFEQQRFADAAALCAGLLAGNPDRTDLWLLQANAFIGLGQPLRAAENYELVERMGRSTTESLSMLADIYVNEGLHDLAVRSHAAALERDPDARAERALRAAKVMTAAGALEETQTLLERVQALRGERLEPGEQKDLLRLRARIAVAQGAGDEEARVLEEIVALDPLDGEALLLLGQHASRSGNAEQAVFYYERAASLSAFEADARVRHAQLLVAQNRYAEALPLLRRAQTLKPRDNVQQYLEQVERAAQTR